jgi:predicted nucleic acid-binding protein
MNVVDSSGWLEYFADGPNADRFAAVLENLSELIVPAISIYEVFKWILRRRGETEALQAVAIMQQGQVVDLDLPMALAAARLSVTMSLPMADSIMLATAQRAGATLWTQDADFRGIDGVQFFETGDLDH